MDKATGTQDRNRQPARAAATQTKQPVALKRLQGKDLKTQQRMLSPAAQDGDEVQRLASHGTTGGGGALPHQDKIQKSFGRFDVAGVRHHADGPAAESSQALGARAFTSGNDVVSNSSSPDLHTAAHEAAHVVQQRAGVAPSGGVGKPGDAHEREADAVADAVVRGESAEPLLARTAGKSGAASGGQAVQKKAVQFIGTPLTQDLKPGDSTPAFGEDKGHQRRYSPEQYVEMWEKEQGRKMSPEERSTLDRGCIGITATNLAGGGNPLDYAEKVFGNFEQAHALMKEKNATLDRTAARPRGGEGARQGALRGVRQALLVQPERGSGGPGKRGRQGLPARPAHRRGGHDRVQVQSPRQGRHERRLRELRLRLLG
jgi:hypothetical protein